MKALKIDVEINCPVLEKTVTIYDIDQTALQLEIKNEAMVQMIKIMVTVRCPCGHIHDVQLM